MEGLMTVTDVVLFVYGKRLRESLLLRQNRLNALNQSLALNAKSALNMRSARNVLMKYVKK
jgi:hypothetical protein